MEREERWNVKFRNVAQIYFPQTRVECCYTLCGEHSWSCRDWIGLFKVGWTSVRDYHTYVWAPAPEDDVQGKDINRSVFFYSAYLPSPGATQYQFVYVDELGENCAVSPEFTFSAPKPLDELVTLEEKGNEEEENEGDDMLLVVPRAHVLQSDLEACQKELSLLQKKLGASSTELEKLRERNELQSKDFESERVELRTENKGLKERLRCSEKTMELMQEKEKDISVELSSLLTERAANQQRIKDLVEDTNSFLQQKQDNEAEVESLRERVKKLMMRRKDEEDERRNLQTEGKHCREESRRLQERLQSSEHSVEVLRRDLSELGVLQSHNQAELNQVRLQAAQTTLQLSQANLSLREGQVAWAKEQENLKKNAELDKERIQKLSHELQKKEEWLQEERIEREKLELELGNEKACNRELRASLRAIQKEREQQQLEKQELVDHIRVLRLRVEREQDAAWNKSASGSSTEVNSASAASPLPHTSHCEEEDEEDVLQRAESEYESTAQEADTRDSVTQKYYSSDML